MADVETQKSTKTQLKPPSMWKVMILNDDFTPMDFVTAVLMKFFHKSHEEAVQIMLTVHHKGRGTVGLYTKDVAETKVMQVMGLAQANGHPLRASAEEA